MHGDWRKNLQNYQSIVCDPVNCISESQTTQTAYTLYLDSLSRPIVSRHAMIQFHVMFLTDISRPLLAFRGFTTFKEIL